MSDFRISIPGGESRRLKTGGKYCPSDIIVEATGGNSGNNHDSIGFFATMQIVNNQSIVPDISNYVGDVTMEGEET